MQKKIINNLSHIVDTYCLNKINGSLNKIEVAPDAGFEPATK